MTGRDRTCDAPRFRRALYRAELRSHEVGGAGARTGDLLLYQRGALPSELSAKWARLGSNQQPLVCETSALPLSYSPVRDPGQGIEPRSPRSERGVLPLDDPGTLFLSAVVTREQQEARRSSPLRPSLRSRSDRRSRRVPLNEPQSHPHVSFDRRSNDVFHASRLPFDPGSAIHSFCARPSVIAVLRGGALEPELSVAVLEKLQAKADAIVQRPFAAHGAEMSFSLRRGLDSV